MSKLEVQCFWKEVHTLPLLAWIHRAYLLRSSGCRNVSNFGLLKMPWFPFRSIYRPWSNKIYLVTYKHLSFDLRRNLWKNQLYFRSIKLVYTHIHLRKLCWASTTESLQYGPTMIIEIINQVSFVCLFGWRGRRGREKNIVNHIMI